MEQERKVQNAWRQFTQTGSVQDYLRFCAEKTQDAKQHTGGENTLCASKPKA